MTSANCSTCYLIVPFFACRVVDSILSPDNLIVRCLRVSSGRYFDLLIPFFANVYPIRICCGFQSILTLIFYFRSLNRKLAMPHLRKSANLRNVRVRKFAAFRFGRTYLWTAHLCCCSCLRHGFMSVSLRCCYITVDPITPAP
jgi:hypothetical protein